MLPARTQSRRRTKGLIQNRLVLSNRSHRCLRSDLNHRRRLEEKPPEVNLRHRLRRHHHLPETNHLLRPRRFLRPRPVAPLVTRIRRRHNVCCR